MSLTSNYLRLPFTFDVPNNGSGLLISVGKADPTGGGVVGDFAPVSGGEGRIAVSWYFSSPASESNGVYISEGIDPQGETNFELLAPGEHTNWPATKPAPYYRVVADGGACRITGWALTVPA